jgi:tetratricopeptide (TPR) repeat protein
MYLVRKKEGTDDAFYKKLIKAMENCLNVKKEAVSLLSPIINEYKNQYPEFKDIDFTANEDFQEELFAAQKYFEQEDFKKALEGDGKFAGLLSIIEDYGSTKGGSLAHYYAGNIYLRQGDYNKAIEHLSSYKGDDIIISSQTKALIADAYVELGQLDKAISNYKDAIKSENIMTTPFVLLKLGQVYEMQKNNVEALNCYKRIKTEFPASQEYREIEKYISRLENLQ